MSLVNRMSLLKRVACNSVGLFDAISISFSDECMLHEFAFVRFVCEAARAELYRVFIDQCNTLGRRPCIVGGRKRRNYGEIWPFVP